MKKFPVSTRYQSPQKRQEPERKAMALEMSGGDPDRVILVSDSITLVVNLAGFDPETWPKKVWKQGKP